MSLLFVTVGILFLTAWFFADRNAKAFVKSCEANGQMSDGIHFIKKGSGPNLLLLHGASSSLQDYVVSGLVEQLQEHFTVYAIDRPGVAFSRTASDAQNYMQSQVDEIVAFMDRQGIAATIIVGHSMGAGVAAALTVQQPSRIKGFMSIAGAVYPIGTGASWYTHLAVAPFGVGWLFRTIVMPLIGPTIAQELLQKNFSPNPVPPDYENRACMKLLFEPLNFYWNAVALNQFIPYLATQYPQYHSIKVPASLIYGADDKVIYTDVHSGEFKKAVPQAKLHMLPSTGHLPHHYHQDLVVKELMRLLNESAQ